ncbi:IS21 family transposase [Dehalobacter sp. E1]|uniref:IS21 family transposase n=1 Tax=Dehalobacter sp. TBBPA1 TaxID=3235037 RepID=UPI0002FCBB19
MIRDLKSKGMNVTQIARELDLDRKTVSKWIKSNELPAYRKRARSKSKLDNYTTYIAQRMNEGCVNAMILFDEIKAMGYQGRMTILRDFMKPHREQMRGKASIRFETPPGKQAQVDWGEFKILKEDGTFIKVHAFIMIMGHSRKQFVEFTENERIETLIGCHERAFTFFGGVPETILYDNMKTVVKHSHQTGTNKWNDKFLRFAKHQEFNPLRCRPYHPRTKGKVENGVKYLRKNFWPRIRTVSSLADLNGAVRLWLDTVCNVRLHQTTREIPFEAFKRENLKPMNPESFLLHDLQSRKVMNDCTVSYEANFYSVPYRFVGRRVGIRDLNNGHLEIYDETGICITSHVKLSGKYHALHNKKHFEGLQTWSQNKVAATAPILIPEQPPKVYQRPLQVYDSLISEVTQ